MVGPGGVPRHCRNKNLHLQTGVKAHIGAKELSAAFANRSRWRPPPDPENGSPGTVATATGADRKADVLKEAPAKYLSFTSLVQSETAAVVYVGQKLIGTIIKHDGRYEAFDAFGRCLGSFSTRADVTRSISHACGVNNNTEAMNTALTC